MASAFSTPHVGNRLLSDLSPDALDRLRPLLNSVGLVSGQILHAPGEAIGHVYFPTQAMAAMIAQEADGPAVEVGLIGREGLIGGWTLLDPQAIAFRQAVVQFPGTALRISLPAFRQAIDQIPALGVRCLLHLRALDVQVTQTAVCNARHTLVQRCARWLLLARDRADGGVLPLMQEGLANMLAVRRSGVTVAASALQTAKLIDYSRGRIVILDRAGLEGAACACYRIVTGETARLFNQLQCSEGSENQKRSYISPD